ncbi:hypothetical protein Tco_0271210 [Tanacetum coccineum]
MSTQQDINAIRAQRLANTHDPLALMANTQTPFHPDHSSHITYIQHPQPNNNFVQQPSFNTNYMQQPMQNPEDISDPTTALDMALELMSKAFQLNNITPTNNNQRSSSNPCYSQIAQSGMNIDQDRQMLMVDDNVGNQFRENAVQNVGHLVGQNAVQNQGTQNVGNQNGLSVVSKIANQNSYSYGMEYGHYASNCTVKPRKWDAAYLQQQLQIAQEEEAGIQSTQKEFDFMAYAGACEETEEQAHLSKEKSIVSSLLEEKKKLKSDFKIRKDELLDKQIQLENKIKELDNILVKTGQSIQTMHMLSPKPDSFYHTEQKMALGYQNPFYLKQAQQKQQSLYNGKVLLEKHDPPVVYDSEETLQLAQESPLKMKRLNKEIKPENYTKINHLSGVFVSQTAKSREELYFSNTSKSANVSKSFSIPNEEFSDDTTPSVARKFLNEIHKIVKDEIFLIVNQVDARVQNFEIQFFKKAAKFVRDFKSLTKEAGKSIVKQKALELEIEHFLREVVSRDIMSIVQNPSAVDTSNLQTELERMKERFKNCIIKKENEYSKLWNDWYKKCEECKYDKISYDKAYNDMQQKIERLQSSVRRSKGKIVLNYAKENVHLKTTYKNLFDSIKVTRAQTKAIIDSLQDKLHDTIYENAKLSAQLFDKVSKQKESNKGTSVNTQFSKQSILGKPPSSSKPKLYFVTPLPKSTVIPKVGKSNALSKQVTSNSAPSFRESTVVNNERVIAPGIFRINPFKASRHRRVRWASGQPPPWEAVGWQPPTKGAYGCFDSQGAFDLMKHQDLGAFGFRTDLGSLVVIKQIRLRLVLCYAPKDVFGLTYNTTRFLEDLHSPHPIPFVIVIVIMVAVVGSGVVSACYNFINRILRGGLPVCGTDSCLEQAPRSPEYVPDPMELEDHVPVYIPEPEHPEDLVPAEDEAPTPPLPPFFLSPRIRPPHTRAAMRQMRAAAPSTYHSLLPSGTLPLLPIPLPTSSTSRRVVFHGWTLHSKEDYYLYTPALKARVTVLEIEVHHHEWQRQAADDLVVQYIMRTQALEAGARVDTLEDTGRSS